MTKVIGIKSFGFLTAVLAATSLYAQSSAGEETAIREVVRKYVDARQIIDPKAIEALFTTDADQLVSSGEWRKGRPEVVRGTVASSKNESGKRSITLESIRFLDANVALADGRYDLEDLNGTTRHMWSTFLFKRGPEGWRIAAIRNMLPAAPAARK
jgi:uncharacterized protein (TIGR02246 family)